MAQQRQRQSDLDPSPPCPCPCPFTLIEEGNQRESFNDYWGASKSFYHASTVLRDQSHERLVPFMDDDNDGDDNDSDDNEYEKGCDSAKQKKSLSKAHSHHVHHVRRSSSSSTSTSTRNVRVRIPRNSDDLKQLKIAALYQDKSWEYYHKAREMFVAAMKQEWEEDANIHVMIQNNNNNNQSDDGSENGTGTGTGTDDYDKDKDKNITSYLEALEKFGTLDAAASSFELCMDTLSKDILMDRQELFHHLFLGPEMEKECNKDIVIPPTAPSPETEIEIEPEPEERALTLEERLARLNSSLPSKMKNEDERMKDLQSGLDNLGVYVPSTTNNNNNNARDILMGSSDKYVSEEDQIAEIIAMAKDEAMLDAKTRIGGDTTVEEEEGGGGSNDVRELLKKASIRIDFDDEEDHYDSDNYDFNVDDDDDDDDNDVYANDPEMAFWKNAISPAQLMTNGIGNGIGNIHVTKSHIDNDGGNDNEPKTDIDKMRKSLMVAQQMLLQAKLCLDEYEEQQQKEGRNGDGDGDGDGDGTSNSGEEAKDANEDVKEDLGDEPKVPETKLDGTFNIPPPPTTIPSSRSMLNNGNDNDENSSTSTKHHDNDDVDDDEDEEESEQEKIASNTDDDASEGAQEGLSEEQVETVVAKAIAEAQGDEEQDLVVREENHSKLNDDDNVDGDNTINTSTQSMNPVTKMGRENLQEAQSLLQEVLQLWPN